MTVDEQRAAAVDRAVKQLDEDLAARDATQDALRRAQLRAEAEQRYLNTVTGGGS